MKTRSTLIAGAALCTLLTVGVAAPALAAPVDFSGDYIETGDYAGGGNGSSWYFESDLGIGHVYLRDSSIDFDRMLHQGMHFAVDGASLSTSTPLQRDTDVNGDIVITGAATYTTGASAILDATVEGRLYAEGDLYRNSFVLTNNTGAPVTYTPALQYTSFDNYGQGTTSSGDQTLDTSDWFFSAYDPSYPSLVGTQLWGNTTAVASVDGADAITNGADADVYFAQQTLAPGEKVQWVFFYKVQAYTDYTVFSEVPSPSPSPTATLSATLTAAESIEATRAEFGGATPTLSGRLARNLDATLASNWAFAAAPVVSVVPAAAPTLAATGVNADQLGLLIGGAALLLAAGAAATVRRRRVARG